MIPIFEQGSGRGIGHGLESFLVRFDAICAEHIAVRRARAFAFIFYDFCDDALRSILKDQGVFAKLDRLSGNQLSVFYLHAGSEQAIETFNRCFFRSLAGERSASLPCIVFFRLDMNTIRDIEIAQLESADLIHGFAELYSAIERYISTQTAESAPKQRALRWIKGGAKFVSIEAFRALLRSAMELLIY